MLTLERQEQILSYMKHKNSVLVSELSKRFFISEATIRRDLEKMEKQHLLKRTYGGAVLLAGLSADMPLLLRENENETPKEQIAHAAARFITDGCTVFLDSSSTAQRLVPFFQGKSGVTVVTNALKTAAKLSELSELSIYCTGGRVRKESVSLVGSAARELFTRYYADVVFFSCRGLDAQRGVTDAADEEAEIKRQMLATARTRVLLCDSTKLDRVFFSLICPVSAVDYIVLDGGVGESAVKRLSEAGAHVLRAG